MDIPPKHLCRRLYICIRTNIRILFSSVKYWNAFSYMSCCRRDNMKKSLWSDEGLVWLTFSHSHHLRQIISIVFFFSNIIHFIWQYLTLTRYMNREWLNTTLDVIGDNNITYNDGFDSWCGPIAFTAVYFGNISESLQTTWSFLSVLSWAVNPQYCVCQDWVSSALICFDFIGKNCSPVVINCSCDTKWRNIWNRIETVHFSKLQRNSLR